MKNHFPRILCYALIALSMCPASHASWFSDKKETPKIEVATPTVAKDDSGIIEIPDDSKDTADLKAFEDQFAKDFQKISELTTAAEAHYLAKNLAAAEESAKKAYALSAQYFRSVREKIGVDIKAKLTERLLIPTTFPAESRQLADLPEDQRRSLIKALASYRSGYFFDILNLAKRTTVQFSKAFQTINKIQSDQVTERARSLILQDLATARLMPIFLKDKRQKELVVFMEDVANPHLSFFFDEDLERYIKANSTALRISPNEFQNYIGEVKKSLIPPSPAPILSNEAAIAKVDFCIYEAIASVKCEDVSRYSLEKVNAASDAAAACISKYISNYKNAYTCKEVVETRINATCPYLNQFPSRASLEMHGSYIHLQRKKLAAACASHPYK